MSWQAYVDSSLVGTGHVQKACIASIAGDSIWATSPGFEIKPDELKVIAKIMQDYDAESNSAIDQAFKDGLYVDGVRYVVTGKQSGGVYARKGKEGVFFTKSKQAVLIAWHGEAGVAGNTSKVTGELAEYLSGQNY
jgi:profilin